MNTPAHLIFGIAAFGRPGQPAVTAAAMGGAVLPDASLYLMAGVSLYFLDIDARVVFGQLYYSPTWQQVFAIDNSFVLWGGLFGAGLYYRIPVLIALSGSAVLHLAFDFPLHNHDARRHFWPVSDWVFESPFSYWDQSFNAAFIGPMELGVSLVLAGLIVVRFRHAAFRLLTMGFAAAETMASSIWRFIF